MWREALERNPEQPEYLVRVASCLLGRDLDRAREYLRRAVQLDPRHANARRLLASVLSRSGADAAEREARDLLVLRSDDLTNWRLQGALMAEKNQLAEAVELFQQIVRRGLPCFVRKPRGLDIYAACGQLKRASS